MRCVMGCVGAWVTRLGPAGDVAVIFFTNIFEKSSSEKFLTSHIKHIYIISNNLSVAYAVYSYYLPMI